ncbi:uncharacterized protein LOC114319258 [Camellia sinensis]|uniref:uncharacterized protein LOC114319258 n=1 Tax=Camellia sinensis TaxID=4442 RepID=UPI0010368A85|nr:uncharacterized protein LOC114319258 [Camellia sinensis]
MEQKFLIARAWMGVEKTRDVVFGDYSSSFDDLRWYVDVANDCNSGSVFYMEFDIDSKGSHFKCLFFAFEACLYPLCFAIVDSERYDNWHWFLSKLFVILTPGRDITFVTDRHGGLLKALAKTNLKTYLSVKCRKSKEYLLTLFSRCAYAPTIELSNELFEEFKGCCGRTIRDKCHLFSTNLVDAIRVELMEQFSKRREVGNKWNRIVCPFTEKKLEKCFNDTKAWIVKKCSDDIHEIQLDHSVMVDIGKRSCSCRLLEIDYFPCKHGFCAIKRSKKDLKCFLDDYYHVRSYCDCYSHSIYLVPSIWKPNVVLDDDVVLPPLCKKPTGCPRIERIPSKGEIKRIRCNRCGKMETHNQKTCKEALF